MRCALRILSASLVVLLAASFLPAPDASAWVGTTPGNETEVYCWGIWRFVRFVRPPGIRCHVYDLDDGSPWFGWKAAQRWDPTRGKWIELRECSFIEGKRVRVNQHSTMKVRDPLDLSSATAAVMAASGPHDPASVPWRGASGPLGVGAHTADAASAHFSASGSLALRDDYENACSAEVDSGLQIRNWEPPGQPVPPAWYRSACAEASAALPLVEPAFMVFDTEEETGVTRVTNPPWGGGLLFLRCVAGPDTFTLHPIEPGMSLRVLPDGSLTEGTVLVEPGPQIHADWGETVPVWFRVYNLGSVEAVYRVDVEDPRGWAQWSGPLVLPVPAHASAEVVLQVNVPPAVDAWSAPIVLRAEDTAEPMQFHRAMSFVLAGRGSIEGVVSYGGPEVGRIQVAAYDAWDLPYAEPECPDLLAGPEPYALDELGPGEYIVAAWLDTDDDGRLTAGEPVGFFDPGGDGEPDPVLVTAGGLVAGVDFALDRLYTPLDLADHDAGNCVLTVTDRGTLGFWDANQTEGSGFVHPAGGPNHLFIGSPWIGLDPVTVANRDYLDDPMQELVVSADPDGHVRLEEGGRSDQDLLCAFTDGGSPFPRGLLVEQVSMAWAAPEDADDFVILEQIVTNRGPDPWPELYVGLFLDPDIEPSAYDDEGAADPSIGLAWLTSGGAASVGLLVLQGEGEPVPIRNASLVHNPTYVWPEGFVPDPDKWAFLSAADPEHILTSSPAPDDYGLVVSAGPFFLPPGGSQRVAFAIAGGMAPSECLENAMAAQRIYLEGVTDVPPGGVSIPAGGLALEPPRPNPIGESAAIRFTTHASGPVRLSIHDPSGRCIRTLISESLPAGEHSRDWDGRTDDDRRAPAGVYFVRLDAGGGSVARRLVVLD